MSLLLIEGNEATFPAPSRFSSSLLNVTLRAGGNSLLCCHRRMKLYRELINKICLIRYYQTPQITPHLRKPSALKPPHPNQIFLKNHECIQPIQDTRTVRFRPASPQSHDPHAPRPSTSPNQQAFPKPSNSIENSPATCAVHRRPTTLNTPLTWKSHQNRWTQHAGSRRYTAVLLIGITPFPADGCHALRPADPVV